ncbi:fructose 1,6-bisphosphatase [Prosthecomicrobium hirschii]|uniref:Fructose-1,6-bisphosphatase class 1 n=1 Tax=Prosthecodimorpha hirschii TaxID=665126 RepID=A0A0P6VHS8_9HYPH|nr:class 1 fructose-bisphosphatase [Prosthecomicrobium hirschii]KPL51637.1 fructose 1,6-bisphosphatase [Prosthecomicrobium hirschii]
MTHQSLAAVLEAWAAGDGTRRAVAATVAALADAARDIAALVADGPLAGRLGAAVTENVQGEVQKELDRLADERILAAARSAPVAAFASEELDHPVVLDPLAPLLLAVDPLDGSSNIDTNVSIGTIFSILPAPADFPTFAPEPGADIEHAPFLQKGRAQLAAGYVIYGPQTALVLTVGSGTWLFTLDRRAGLFKLTGERLAIPAETREFAINASNSRHWDDPIRSYVEDLLAGDAGVRGQDFNMRWIASLVAECHRILVRGGVFLYPADRRKGYHEGRLRLMYEANPIAFVVEQAGGGASTGTDAILDLEPARLHQRVPFIFGSHNEIERIEHHHAFPDATSDRAPLFGKRGLFRE